jgi:FkbM family methyltransferase
VKVRIVDVGARGGIHPRWNPYFDRVEILGFDADANECERLNSSVMPYQVRFLPVTLGALDGEEATLHVCRQPGCSSLLVPNHALCSRFAYGENLQVVRTVPLRLSRLDSVCADFRPDVLKIDTQGSELAILSGAVDVLKSTALVELEVEFAEIYVDQPLFGDVDQFMRRRGFELLGIRRSYWRRIGGSGISAMGGQLIHGDALYINSRRQVDEQMLIALEAYGQHDLMNALDREAARGLIRRRTPLQRIFGGILSGWTNRQQRRWVDSIRDPAATDWHDPDFF